MLLLVAVVGHRGTLTTNNSHSGCPRRSVTITHPIGGEKVGRHELLSPLGEHSTGAYVTPGRAYGAPFRTFLARYSSRFLNDSDLEAESETIKATLVVNEEELEAQVRE
jgi:hypothetical protein